MLERETVEGQESTRA